MRNRINLFNYHQQEINYLKIRVYLLLGLAVLLAIIFNLFMYLDIQYKIDQQKDENLFWTNQLQMLNKQVAPIQDFKKRAAEIETKIKLIKIIEGKSDATVALMHEIHYITPDKVYYTNLNVNIATGALLIKGVAGGPLFVAQLLDKMRESDSAFTNAKLKSNVTNDQNSYNFEIEAIIDKKLLRAEFESSGR